MGYTKTQVYSKKILDVATAAVSAVTSVTGIFDTSESESATLQYNWGANVTGSFTAYQQAHTDAPWVSAPAIAAAFIQPAGSTGSGIMDLTELNAMAYNIRFTRTSGTTGPIQMWAMVGGFV